MIAAHELTVWLSGAPRLGGVSLEARGGEVLALVGPNGSGKSTLIAALAGDLAPRSGTVLLDGAPLSTHDRITRARRLAVLPQTPEASAGLTASEVVRLGLEIVWGEADPHAVRRALHEVGLHDRLHTDVRVLSGGERQRVHLARVLAQTDRSPSPAVLLLDEPLSAQDPRWVRTALAAARARARNGHAVVCVLHDLLAATALADRTALLSAGHLTACGPTATVLVPALLSAAYGTPFELSTRGAAGAYPVPVLDLETP